MDLHISLGKAWFLLLKSWNTEQMELEDVPQTIPLENDPNIETLGILWQDWGIFYKF